MTSDSQRAGHDPDESASGADWVPPRTERSGTAAPRGDRTPPEFGWAMPDASWESPGNSWTVAYPDAASTWSQRPSSDPEFPGGWPPPLDEPPHRPAPPPAESASGRADDRLPKRVPGQIDLPENGPGGADGRYEQTVRAPRAAVPAPPPPLPPQATRIPGASLAAEPPLGYPPPDQYEPPAGRYQPEPPYGRRPVTPYDFGVERQPAPAERWADDPRPSGQGDEGSDLPAGHGRARVTPQAPTPTWEAPPPYLPGSPVETPQQSDRSSELPYGAPGHPAAAAKVPAQRSAPAESGDSASAGSGISASATVPAASRMSPPSDPAARSMPAAQPTVYGRSVDDHVEPVRHDRTADAAGGDEPLWPRTPADTGDRFPSGAEAAESRLRGGTEDRFQRDAGPWPPAGAEPWSSDDRPDVRSEADRSSERPGRAAAFAQVPVPPIQAPHADQPREPGGRFARTDGAPDAFGAIGPLTGTARPVSPARGVAQPARVDDLRPSDEGGNRAPVAPWDDQPQRQRWAGGAGNPDQTLSGAWDGLDTGDARADAWPGTRAEAPPAGRATAAGTARVGGRDTEDGPPRQQSGAATGADSAPPWVDRDDRQQERFDSFRSEMERPADPPPPQVRNARVLAMVLAAAVLLLAVPLGTLWLLGRTGDQGFNPAVGSCVKQDGAGAVAAGCGDAGAYSVAAKANDPGKCDPKQPHIVLQNVKGDNVLCLRPAATK